MDAVMSTTETTSQHPISVDQVRIAYPPRQRGGQWFVAVDDASFQIADGEFVTIVGPSGCGKSTLLFAVDGLLQCHVA
jgi:NitT/TauT family transport system ATP-binding protein